MAGKVPTSWCAANAGMRSSFCLAFTKRGRILLRGRAEGLQPDPGDGRELVIWLAKPLMGEARFLRVCSKKTHDRILLRKAGSENWGGEQL